MSQSKRALVRRDSDHVLVDKVIAKVGEIYHQGLLATAIEVGDRIIEEFFLGDLDLAASFRPDKPRALSILFDRIDELPISAHALKRIVRVTVQYHQMPRVIADGLTRSQHEVLLAVRDPPEKLELAEGARARGLTVRQLEREVRKRYPPHPGGRKKEPPPLRLAAALERAASSEGLAAALEPATLRALAAGEVAEAHRRLRRAGEVMKRLSDALDRHARG